MGRSLKESTDKRNRKRPHEEEEKPAVKKSRSTSWGNNLADTICCRICCDEKPSHAFVFNKNDLPPACYAHLGIGTKGTAEPTCKACILAHLVASIELKGPERLGCLHEDCGAVWDHTILSKFFTKEAHAQLNDALLKTFIATHPAFVHCPQKDCQSGGIVDKGRSGYPQLECHDCKQRFCALCVIPWHADMTCSTFRAKHGLDKEDRETTAILAGQNARRCPHCQFVIIKMDGCDNMYCEHCHRGFLWSKAERMERTRVNPVRAATKKYKDTTAGRAQLPVHYREPVCEAEAPPRPPPVVRPNQPNIFPPAVNIPVPVARAVPPGAAPPVPPVFGPPVFAFGRIIPMAGDMLNRLTRM